MDKQIRTATKERLNGEPKQILKCTTPGRRNAVRPSICSEGDDGNITS